MSTRVSDDEHPDFDPEGGLEGFQGQDALLSAVTVSEQLQDLVLDSGDVGEFLRELCVYSAALASVDGDEPMDCAVTLYRRRRALTGGGNTDKARMLNEIQARMGEGPCLTALVEQHTVVVDETRTDLRWPEYAAALVKENVYSVLAVPLVLEQGAAASINFFSSTPFAFTAGIVASAEQYAAQAQKALRLAVRIGSKQQIAEDLQEAMKSRTAIDLAVGVIMGQQRCSQSAAFELLSRASSSRNQKLREVAEALLANITKSTVATHFEE
ncbi:GAF and ANTAR domain-containing protein [Arthrobacter sp. STN4]|uniref:GAF and ANTAR domain-containing protein n=1 Tax=Arthrobacter sp. STN4 TaxID=2923276 RepID=UPI00211A4974|nr:GAF and ANTAR domain-containing protein [Arthrobacter sp. STN4]MCQ9163979.1 GAF and ANTAR domain-containing protein [Arthrobacter sp. STN4]